VSDGAEVIVNSIRDRGVTLRSGGDKILAKPFHWLTEADLAALKEHREAVLDLLHAELLPACWVEWDDGRRSWRFGGSDEQSEEDHAEV
jgi:hypothetical protein